MPYVDGLKDGFTTDSKGNLIFYRWGIFGKGHVLPDETKKEQLRKFVRLWSRISLPIVIGIWGGAGWVFGLGVMSVILLSYDFLTRWLLEGLPTTPTRLTLRESCESSANSYSLTFLRSFFGISLLFALVGFYALFVENESSMGWVGVFFGICAAGFGYMIKLKTVDLPGARSPNSNGSVSVTGGGTVTMSPTNEQLYEAVKQNDLPAASAALKAGASANYVHLDEEDVITTRVHTLYAACKNQNKELVEFLLAHGADPNAEYVERATWGSEHEPCLFAAMPSLEIVRALLQQGADPNIPSVWREDRNNYTSALEAASRSGNQHLVNLLRHYGARMDTPES